MALHTETFLNVLKRWCGFCGIEYADLLSNESELFTQYAQARLRKIWSEADWPDIMNVREELLVDQKFTAGSTIAFIHGIFQYHPLETVSTSFKTYNFRRMQDSVYVYGSSVPDYVYVLYKERVPAFSANTDTVPYRFAEYIAAGAAADYYRTLEDTVTANIYEGRASALLMDELEIHEQDEHARQWENNVSVYSPVSI